MQLLVGASRRIIALVLETNSHANLFPLHPSPTAEIEISARRTEWRPSPVGVRLGDFSSRIWPRCLDDQCRLRQLQGLHLPLTVTDPRVPHRPKFRSPDWRNFPAHLSLVLSLESGVLGLELRLSS